MKLDARRIAGFLRDPGQTRAVVLFGEDHGLIRERADALVRAIAGGLDDPFRVVELARDAWGTLADEAAGLSLMGGRRVIRVRDATDVLTKAAQAMLSRPGGALVVIEAPGLTTKAKLVTALTAAPDAAAIGCYPEEGRALTDTITETLAADQVRCDPDALAWLGAHLGADRAATRSELTKLALYIGPGGTVDLDAARAVVADAAGLSLDDAMVAAITGDVAAADRALEIALDEGATAVGVLRVAAGQVQRLHRARLAVDAGASADEAVRALRPPVFFRDAARIAGAVRLWSEPALRQTLAALVEAERACKRTGAPDATLCRQAVLSVARRARAGRSGAGVGPRSL